MVSPVTKGTISLPARYGLASAPSSVRIMWPGMSSGRFPVVFSKLSKLLNQENALSAPCLKHFRNYGGPIKVARCGFPREKTTKRPIAPRISCSAALAKNNDVRLSSRKVACSSVVPTTSTGNPVRSAPIAKLLTRWSCSPQAPPRAGVILALRFHIIVCYTLVITPTIDFLKTLFEVLSKAAAKSFVLSRWSNFHISPPS
jgi:hypothetical protein